MDETPAGMTMEEYRDHYRKKRVEFLKNVTKENFGGITDVIVVPPSVDMAEIKGTDQEVAAAIDRFYANDGRYVSERIPRLTSC
jgi:hypothetical protein